MIGLIAVLINFAFEMNIISVFPLNPFSPIYEKIEKKKFSTVD